LNDKKYIQYSENFAEKNSVFEGKRQLLKNPEQYIQCIFTWGDSCNLG